MAAPARIGLDDAQERHLALVDLLAVFADLVLHVVDALGPHLPDHLAGARQIGVEAEEVDAVLQWEDLRLVVQPQAEGLDALLDLLQDPTELQLVAADDVEVVHVPAVHEAEIVAQPVVEVVEVEQGEELAALVPDRDAGIWRAVDDLPQKPHREGPELLVLEEHQGLACLLITNRMEQGVKELREIALQHPPVSVVPLVHWAVWQAGGPAGLLVCRLPAEKVVTHGAGEPVEAVVGAFSSLAGIVVANKAPAEVGLEDVVTEGVLHHLPLEVNGEDEALLGLVDLEGVIRAEGIVTPLKPLREAVGALHGLHAVAHGRGVVALAVAGLFVGGI